MEKKEYRWNVEEFNSLSNEILYKIIGLREQVFVVEQNCPYLDVDGKDIEAIHLYLQNKHGEIIAYARIISPNISYSEASIGRVVVAQAYREKGVGRILMQKAIIFCLEKYKTDIRISAQQHLERFYESLGFSSTSEPYLEDGIPHFSMLLKFSNKHSE